MIPLWRDSEAAEPNLTGDLLSKLAADLGEVTPEDLFAYVYVVLAGNYTERFRMELEVPGPRIPITKDPALFARAAELGGRLIWLHTYGERLAPDGEKPGEIPAGTALCTVGVSTDPKQYPETFCYDPASMRLNVGDGVFERVAPAVWDFEVSGLQVVKSWLSYRMKEGAGRVHRRSTRSGPSTGPRSSPRSSAGCSGSSSKLLELTPDASTLLAEIVDGELFQAGELPTPTAEEIAAPKAESGDQEQLSIQTVDPA